MLASRQRLSARVRTPFALLRNTKVGKNPLVLSHIKEKNTICVVFKGYILLCKMHFAEPYACKLRTPKTHSSCWGTPAQTTAFGSCPHPICIATQYKGGKESSRTKPYKRKKHHLCGVFSFMAQEEGFEPPWLLAKRFSRLVSHLELNGN